MSWQRLLDTHPLAPQTGSSDFWEEYLADHPDVLHRLLADIYQAVYGAERPPTLDDLWALMAREEFSSKAFGDAVDDLLAGRSVRWLAQQVGVHHSVMTRFLRGERSIISVHDTKGSMQRIEAVAEALRVHPSYFGEWRRLWIMSLLDGAFANSPSLSVGIFKRFASLEPNGRSGRRTA